MKAGGVMVVINKSYHVVAGFLTATALFLGAQQADLSPTAADQTELQHIIHEVDQAKGRGYTQTEAHMSVPSVQEAMSGELNLARNKRIITEALHKERALTDDYLCILYCHSVYASFSGRNTKII